MSFTDQKRRVATKEEGDYNWGFGKGGEYFRCGLCGHKFKEGDGWRWVYGQPNGNFKVCDDCDGEGVLERWVGHRLSWNRLKKDKYWYFNR